MIIPSQYNPGGPLTGYSETPGQYGTATSAQLAAPSGGGGQFPTGQSGPLYQMRTSGFGMMPSTASRMSQAWMDFSRGQRTPDNPWGYTPGQSQAAYMNFRGAEEEEERARQGFMQQQKMWGFQNQLWQKLLGLFGGQGAGGGDIGMPSPVQADPQILAGIHAKIDEEFSRPGGLESQLQRLDASQNRFASGSGLAASRRASLDRARAGAKAESYVPAQQATVMGMQPGLRLAEINRQGQITPQWILQTLMQMQQGRMA